MSDYLQYLSEIYEVMTGKRIWAAYLTISLPLSAESVSSGVSSPVKPDPGWSFSPDMSPSYTCNN